MKSHHIRIAVRGYTGPGWELEVVGPRKWAEKTLTRFVPRVKAASKRF